MEESRLSFLFDGYFNDVLTADEKAEFLAMSRLAAHTAELERLMENKWKDFRSDEVVFDNTLRDKMLKAIYSAEQQQTKTVRLWPRAWQQWSIAAAVATIIFGATLFYYNAKNSGRDAADQVAQQDSIRPGSNKAVLVLANGKRISLTDAKNGQLTQLSGITITKTKDGTVVYHVSETAGTSALAEFNTIETPRGGQYTINLPDGTSATLNASSSLKFPSSFSKASQRVVELKGEGYFEVAKDRKKPFIVKTFEQEVEVLGTHFNVNAYPEERGVKTTLLEGSVRVNKTTLLKPGQQSLLYNQHMQVATVDTDAETAWKNGRLTFTGRDFKSIMLSIARWYDVEIIYNYNPGDLRLSGGISRFGNINDVLDLLKETGEVKFKIEGRRITVIK